MLDKIYTRACGKSKPGIQNMGAIAFLRIFLNSRQKSPGFPAKKFWKESFRGKTEKSEGRALRGGGMHPADDGTGNQPQIGNRHAE